MIIYDVLQGSDGWHKLRASVDGTASELAAAAGESKYQTRSELMLQKSTGLTKEIDSNTQALFNKGHAAEEAARVLAEEIIGEELYPVVGTITIDGLTLLASFDGMTADDSIIFEHKLYNKQLAEDVLNQRIPNHYTLQMDQQLVVSGAEKCMFMTSDGTKENLAWCWYYPEQEKFDNVIRVWQQFRSDLANYVPNVIVETPKAEAIIELPSVIVQVKGELTLCNIADMRPVFDKFLSEATVNLVTDNDFSQAEAESKIGREAAKRCLATAKGVIDQTASISEVTRELELYAAKFNALALSQEKAVKTQKESRKLAIMNEAKAAFGGHVAALEVEIHPIRLVTEQPNFADAMKNKRLLSAIQDAVDSELARVKIEADSMARMIRVNLSLMSEYAPYQFLFTDLPQIIYKPFDDLKLLVTSRITEHEKREAEKLEVQRVQIEAEAKRKAEAEQAEKLEVERAKVRADEQAKINEERRLEKIKAEEEAKARRKAETEQTASIEAAKPVAQESNATAFVDTQKTQAEVIFVVPTREQLIYTIAERYRVTCETAEGWLLNSFK